MEQYVCLFSKHISVLKYRKKKLLAKVNNITTHPGDPGKQNKDQGDRGS